MALQELVEQVVLKIVSETRGALISDALADRSLSLSNERHSDNFLSKFDLRLDARYRELFTESLGSVLYMSEESDPSYTSDSEAAKFAVLVDPLDTTELAVRGLHAYTHVLCVDLETEEIVGTIVGDFFHEVCLYSSFAEGYSSFAGSCVVTRDGQRFKAKPRNRTDGDVCLISNYSMRPKQRFTPLTEQTGLLDYVGGLLGGRLGVDFGSVGLCHVATGATDAFVEFAKGFAVWDLWPGAYFLQQAGGTVLDLDGNPLQIIGADLVDPEKALRRLSVRQKFVAASSRELAEELVQKIHST